MPKSDDVLADTLETLDMLRADLAEEDLGTRVGETLHGVVLCQPVPGIAQLVGCLGQLQGRGNGLRGRVAGDDG